jgi:putative NADH-flavin reductase
MSIQSVALLGADGNLGPSILQALVSHGFDVTVLKRESSKSQTTYPGSVSVQTVPDGFEVDDLVGPLRGHDAAIIAIRSSDTDLQIRFADACVKAGVKRMYVYPSMHYLSARWPLESITA